MEYKYRDLLWWLCLKEKQINELKEEILTSAESLDKVATQEECEKIIEVLSNF